MSSRSGGDVERDLQSDVSRGLVSGVSRVAVLSQRSIATAFNSLSAAQDVWPIAGVAEMVLPTANESWEILSSSALDALGNTGAEAVSITALDSGYNELAVFTVNLNGTTPVTLPNGATYYRLNGAAITGVNAVQTRRKNQGDITIRVVGGGAIRGIILAFTGGLAQAVYTVPINKTLEIFSIEIQCLNSGGGTARGADFRLNFRNPNGVTTAPRQIDTTDVQPYALDAKTRIRVASRFDFIIQCVYTSNNTMTVGIAWEGNQFIN